eukprot:TRINITY_DN95096_c0_g1_i1.p1 TRINITY_DN95096_c0_g1~~TRINITY_DN95096_c0_g1_i1.p1  ORF type:complete len:193 (+),score=42.65 TRINITY_DN95096_c0_g1_i1:116-694(+)
MATEAEEDAPLDLQGVLNDLVEKNRHVAAMALVAEGHDDKAVVAGMPEPNDASRAALSSAFFEGEDAGSMDVNGHSLAVAGRSEIGDLLLVHLSAAAADAAKASTSGASSAATMQDAEALTPSCFLGPEAGQSEAQPDACTGVVAGPAPTAGAFIVTTQRWILVAAYDAGMDATMTMRVCVGVAEYLIGEGQ